MKKVLRHTTPLKVHFLLFPTPPKILVRKIQTGSLCLKRVQLQRPTNVFYVFRKFTQGLDHATQDPKVQ